MRLAVVDLIAGDHRGERAGRQLIGDRRRERGVGHRDQRARHAAARRASSAVLARRAATGSRARSRRRRRRSADRRSARVRDRPSRARGCSAPSRAVRCRRSRARARRSTSHRALRPARARRPSSTARCRRGCRPCRTARLPAATADSPGKPRHERRLGTRRPRMRLARDLFRRVDSGSDSCAIGQSLTERRELVAAPDEQWWSS